MFDSLTERLDAALKKLTGRGKLSEPDVDAGLREVRLALLEADVNYKVARDFVARIRARAVGAEVMESLTPGQQLVKIVHEEMIALLGTREPMAYAATPPTVIVLAGLQGAGKTTAAGKLALFTRREGHRPLLVSTDGRRPAAMEQLEILAKSINAPSFAPRDTDPVAIARNSLNEARRVNADVIIIDTAGRLQTQRNLVEELAKIGRVASKALEGGTYESLLVLDAVLGLTSLVQAREFNRAIPITGLVLAKLDSSAKGGAVIAIEAELGVPVKLAGVGEGIDDLTPFDPEAFVRSLFEA
jgi:signal recognition particle subunit SRP54